jgi:cephalosporin-C deacetylase-like acetyl esterase
LGVEIRGLDPTVSPEEAIKTAPIGYNPFEIATSATAETTWIYYAYCTMARAYDILETLPEVNPKQIYIIGTSQGGGLALAAASLRPQNAGVIATVPGLCRLDWRDANGGGWGPIPAKGPDHDRLLTICGYFDDCNLVPRIRSRAAIGVGLLDNSTPPHAAIFAYSRLSGEIGEKHLIVNPWIGHSGWPEVDNILPAWMAKDKSKDH